LFFSTLRILLPALSFPACRIPPPHPSQKIQINDLYGQETRLTGGGRQRLKTRKKGRIIRINKDEILNNGEQVPGYL